MIKRKKTKVVKVGNIKIGGSNPIVIQSMTKTDTRDVAKTIKEIKQLEKAGCEIVRVAVKNIESAQTIRKIKKSTKIPIVCDIHYDYRLALESIKHGADKIRINPGNLKNITHFREIIKAAKTKKIPIRIGLNSGSLQEHKKKMLDTAKRYIKFFEKEKFHDIIVSIKSSDVAETIVAYKKLSALCRYPLHLGVTAAGPYDVGIVKSSIGIGSLLSEGIGDTIRVSLTGDPVTEVVAAKRILQALGLRSFVPNIISCPTCGRCQVNLVRIVSDLEKNIKDLNLVTTKPISVAVMGCEVNGPGEAKIADIGVAFGKTEGVLFKKGKIVKSITTKNAVKELLKYL